MTTILTQDEVDAHMDDLMEDVMDDLKDAGPVELIAVGTALILNGLSQTPRGQQSLAWEKLRDFVNALPPTNH